MDNQCIQNKKNQASVDPLKHCDGRKIGSVSLAANKSAMKERGKRERPFLRKKCPRNEHGVRRKRT